MTQTEAIAELLQRQDGVVSRKQALECGCSVVDVRRRLRRREWATVYPGVYVDHTGPLTWRQRAWAAVLDAYPAALCHTSVLPDPHVAWNMCPPRLRIHDAVLDIAASARCETQAIAGLTDSVNSRITAVPQLMQALAARKIAAALAANGWPGPFTRCSNCPPG